MLFAHVLLRLSIHTLTNILLPLTCSLNYLHRQTGLDCDNYAIWLHSAGLGRNTWCDNSGGAVERECMTLSYTDTGLVRSLPSGGWRKHTAYSPPFITSLGSSNGLSTRHKHLACTFPLTGVHCQPYLYEVVITEAMAINPFCNLGTKLTWCQFKRLTGSSICASQFYRAYSLTHQPRRQVIALMTCYAFCAFSATWFVLGRQHIFNKCRC